MLQRFGWSFFIGFMFVAPVLAQPNPVRLPATSGDAAEPEPQMRPRVPTLIQRPAPETPEQKPVEPPKAPFTLSPDEQAQVDRVLNLWEERNRGIKTFDCRFKRWTYDLVFAAPLPGQPLKPKFVDVGMIRYAAPDRGVYRVETTENDGAMAKVDDARAEHWISDGKSIFIFAPNKKQVIEQKLPAELQGKAIADGPLPFVFGAEAKKLKERYWIRLITPPDVKDQIWLSAYPRFQQDAGNFHHAEFIITTQKMEPYGLKLVQPNEKDFMAYQFFDIVINDPLRLFKGDPFRPFTPLGWQKIVQEPPQPAEARRDRNGVSR
jgi:TIGR03009 family protein